MLGRGVSRLLYPKSDRVLCKCVKPCEAAQSELKTTNVRSHPHQNVVLNLILQSWAQEALPLHSPRFPLISSDASARVAHSNGSQLPASSVSLVRLVHNVHTSLARCKCRLDSGTVEDVGSREATHPDVVSP